ncbi:MAG: hypothetical protein AB7Q17_17805 [Phycisphaerae bacterium]
MPLEFGIVYPLWCHTREPGGLLDRAAGEVGIDFITVPVVTGEIEQFRLGWFPEQPYFHTEGGWHFPPRAPLYAASGIKPRAAKWCGSRDVLADVCEEATKRGIRVLARLEHADCAALTAAAPHLARRDAWGSAYPRAKPCLLNPAFHELVRATVEDLQRSGVAGVQLGRFTIEQEYAAASTVAVIASGAGLMTCCFCAACREAAGRAGVDAESAERSVRVTGAKSGERRASPPGNVIAPDGEPLLREYVGAMRGAWRDWLQALPTRAAAARWQIERHGLSAEFSGGTERLVSAPWEYLYQVPVLASFSIGPEKDDIAQMRKAHPGTRAAAIHTLSIDVGRDGGEFVSMIHRAARSGVEFFQFSGIELESRGVLDWLRQAVRYARRG